MRISLHIGPDAASGDRIARILAAKRDALAAKGVLYARAPGSRNHTRLFMACSDAGAVDSLRFNRGFIDPAKQAQLYDDLARDLAAEVAREKPDHLILCAHQLGSALSSRSELVRLHALLAPLSPDIRVVAHVQDPARMLLRRYHAQLLEGRATPLSLELEAAQAPDFRAAALASRPAPDPQAGLFAEVQGAAFWLDLAGLEQAWRDVFDSVAFHGIDEAALYGEAGTDALRRAFDLPGGFGKAEPEAPPAAPSAAWQTRCRLFNEAALRLLAKRDSVLHRQLWRKLLAEMKVPGAPIDPGSLSVLSDRFAGDIAALCARHPGLDPAQVAPAPRAEPWQEADPTLGFRATQYLAAFHWRIRQATKEHMAERAHDLARLAETGGAGPDAGRTAADALTAAPAQEGAATRTESGRGTLAPAGSSNDAPEAPPRSGSDGPISRPAKETTVARTETGHATMVIARSGNDASEVPTASGTYAKALLIQTPLAGGDPAPLASTGTAQAQRSEADFARSRRDGPPPETDVSAPPRRGSLPPSTDIDPLLTPEARRLMPPLAKQNFARLQGSRFAPHNRLGAVNEEDRAAPYSPAPPRALPEGSSGNVILACMKNEGPYILEWVAYHRAVGFDNFLVYTNGCEDGTAQILDRLQALGVLQHRDNDDWQGKSPQTHALDRALSEPVIRDADWIAHIDVDEFVNIRCGNGTLADVFAAVPEATNIAMTWRLFGHNGVIAFEDRPVIAQFDTCAPSFCPKPHTAWGFKTLFRNIGAYGKLSCHRPNKLSEAFEGRVKWVNGSGRDMTREAAKNGWRNSKKTIGYDMVQLNHYALRSADSFLVKRQRGRALHVDRSIGLNYWIRMDWSVHRDLTIQRNLPRLRAEMDRLLADPVLAEWHAKACDWHRAKAAELRGIPEFAELYDQALALKLTETERVAYALALDMET